MGCVINAAKCVIISEVQNCTVLGYYTTNISKAILTFRDKVSVRNYHYTSRNSPEYGSSHVFRGGSLKARKCIKRYCGLLMR